MQLIHSRSARLWIDHQQRPKRKGDSQPSSVPMTNLSTGIMGPALVSSSVTEDLQRNVLFAAGGSWLGRIDHAPSAS